MNKRKLTRIIQFTLFTLLAIIMIVPFLWAVGVSLQGPGQAYNTPPTIFQPPFRFENYVEVLSKYDFGRYFLNTLTICIINMIGVVLSNSMIAFGFAKFESKGLNALFFIGLCTMYVPAVTMMVPSYTLWNKLGALDTFVPLTLGSFFGAISWIFLMRQNFKSLPNSFYEAAYMDGANPFYIYWKIYMPLCKPIIATLILRQFMGDWNNLQGPLIYITSKEKYTAALAMSALGADAYGRVEIEMAGAVIMMIPVIIVYLLAQRHFIGGIADAGVKG
ncbi:MAG: carbohydrate ABC transporter permease [Ruminococcaceae bacterium]|nr:carbohydrate ABC transporter permease [Oscillospiraceae bacterium]